MGFFKGLRGEFIDIIEWTDNSNNTLVYRFERHDNEIKNGAKLTVREGQAAVFINEGKIADVFMPGMYSLTTENLPILSTLKGWKYGFDSPFKAEVYFISTRNFTDQKWGTKNPITLSDSRFGMLEIRAFGTYVIKVNDPTLFIREIVGTDGHFTTEEISNQLRSLVVTRFTDAIGEAGLPVEKYAANTNEISGLVKGIMQEDFKTYGIDLTNFLIENISMPDEIKTEIFELSRLNTIDLDKFAKIKAAKAMEKAAENESGTAGAGMGMGMGFAMANQMGQSFTQQQPNQTNNPNSAGSPPPVPNQTAFHVVVNGQQSGPHDMATLQQMIAQHQLTKDSLVWKQGMNNWTAAGQINEFYNLFGSVPPPLPPQE
ncbi:SPFH domain-containing protein [Marivirga sp. S37H4]|uniref:SPFH domain-containing protein n=1 Tax=Marivirga aurantiaca TaxID=2802615 RepID=A0A934WY13_9BACT|nr:SPFH domain-containing protein [Marivirga aurantiaca]MBK6264930.1 SPFH domain-containing protein [Marivirga aurantiaca]